MQHSYLHSFQRKGLFFASLHSFKSLQYSVCLKNPFFVHDSKNIRDSIADCLPSHSLAVLVPVLERFVVSICSISIALSILKHAM